jgi:hypothetical protein
MGKRSPPLYALSSFIGPLLPYNILGRPYLIIILSGILSLQQYVLHKDQELPLCRDLDPLQFIRIGEEPVDGLD